MIKKNYFWFILFLFAFAACKESQPQERIAVGVEKASVKDVEIFGEYVGSIRAQQRVEVRARVEGYLEQILFEEGKRVEKNQPLFIINKELYRARVDRAAAQLKNALAQEAKSERDVKRLRPLYEQNAASQLDLDNAMAAYENATASVAMSKADLAQAQLELGYTTVRSPISGYISESSAGAGALVGPGAQSLLATVVSSDSVFVDFSLTALDYLTSQRRNVYLGVQDTSRSWQPTITVTLADNSVYPEEGIVDFADPQVDPKTGTFGVRAILPNPNRTLLPGQFTKVKLLLDVRPDAVVIPIKSAVIEKGGVYVYVMKQDSTAEQRFIETGPEFGNYIVVERGLGRNEIIITEGYNKLNVGDKLMPHFIEKKEEEPRLAPVENSKA